MGYLEESGRVGVKPASEFPHLRNPSSILLLTDLELMNKNNTVFQVVFVFGP